MAQRQAVTKTNATWYKRTDKAGKGLILDELCATTGWHRNHARKALSQALTPRLVRPRAPRRPIYTARKSLLRWRSAGRCWAPDGEAAGPDHGRVGAQAATFPGSTGEVNDPS